MNSTETPRDEREKGPAYAVPSTVLCQTVGDEAVLLDLDSGVYYGLDPVGARAWALLVNGCSLDEVCATMLEEYEVEADTLRRDLEALLTELEGRKLLVRR